LRFRGSGRRPARREVEQPDVAGIFQQARRLVQIGVRLARAAGPADLVGHLDAEARQRGDDALLVVRHVVEHGPRQEEGIVRHPLMIVNLALEQRRGDRDGAAAASARSGGSREGGVVIDPVHDERSQHVIERDEDQKRQKRTSGP
jgi:hypothetical protein